MDSIQIYYEKLADTVISNLKKRQMEGYYFPTAKEAVEKAMSLLPENATVGFGGSMTLVESGMYDALKSRGNRVAALIYGPKEVFVFAGMNKLSPTVEDAVRRVRNTATPPNCIRLQKQTPCSINGTCSDCLSPDCICNQIVITRRSGVKGRIKVFLIGEPLGF